MRLIFALFALACVLCAQTTINGSRTISGDLTVTGNVDHSGSTTSKPSKAGTSLPGTCAAGETYIKTDATAANQLYICTSTNTWTAQGGSGNGGDTLTEANVRIWDEFMNAGVTTLTIGALGWQAAGTSQGIATLAGEANHPGIYRMTTNGAADRTATVNANNATLTFPSLASTVFESVFVFRTGDVLTSAKYRVGFSNTGPAEGSPSSGFYLEFRNSASGCTTNATDTEWQYVKANGTPARTAGPAINASTWYKLRIRSTVSGTVGMALSTAGGAYGTETTWNTDLPTGNMMPFFMAVTCETTTKRIDVDYFHYKQDTLTR